MKKSSIISFIALELAGTAVADSFDCDVAETDDGGPGVSGFYCGGSQGNARAELAYCYCKKHDSCKKSGWGQTCTAREDKSGVSRTCVRGNSRTNNYRNWRRFGEQAYCQRVPQPGNTICAVDKGVLPANRVTVENVCSKVDEYFLWKDSYDNSAWQLSQLKYVEQDGIEWWKLNFLPKVANVTGGFEDYADFQAKLPTVDSAWNANCKTEAKEYSCYRAFPECKKVEGEGEDVPGFAKCEAECKEVDTCIRSVETACETAKAAGNSDIIECFTYADLFPEYVTSDGQRDCKALCEENQTNSANALVGLSFFTALFMLY